MLNLPARIEHKIAIHPISVIFMAAIFLRGIERHEKSTGRRPIYKKFYCDGSSECAAACDWLHRARMGWLNWLRRFPHNLSVFSIPSQCRLSTISGFVLNFLAVRPQSKSLVIKMNGWRHFTCNVCFSFHHMSRRRTGTGTLIPRKCALSTISLFVSSSKSQSLRILTKIFLLFELGLSQGCRARQSLTINVQPL